MADSMKPKLLLRSGASFSTADRTPSPGARLMLNHGKPNFTIQRTTVNKQVNGSKIDNSSNSNNSNIKNNSNNNNLNAINLNNQKGKHYNDVLKPTTNIKSQLTPTTTTPTTTPTPTEGPKFILRRTKTPKSFTKSENEDAEPEFIKAQRRIQERLAKDNILDFDKRKSGYFTQVMMSPTSPNSKTTFGETMESPEPMPTLEFTSERSSQKTAAQVQNVIEQSNGDEKKNDDTFISLPSSLTNGQDKFEFEKTVLPNEKISVQNGHLDSIDEKNHIEELPEEKQNGHQKDIDDSAEEVPVPQTNGYSIPELPSPDPSGIKGVNYEPTTVVSFAHELSNEPNKYPDTVKIMTDAKSSNSPTPPPPLIDEELQELVKLKFDIETDQEEVKVTPVLRTDG